MLSPMHMSIYGQVFTDKLANKSSLNFCRFFDTKMVAYCVEDSVCGSFTRIQFLLVFIILSLVKHCQICLVHVRSLEMFLNIAIFGLTMI